MMRTTSVSNEKETVTSNEIEIRPKTVSVNVGIGANDIVKSRKNPRHPPTTDT
jgi:hypothetical protein